MGYEFGERIQSRDLLVSGSRRCQHGEVSLYCLVNMWSPGLFSTKLPFLPVSLLVLNEIHYI